MMTRLLIVLLSFASIASAEEKLLALTFENGANARVRLIKSGDAVELLRRNRVYGTTPEGNWVTSELSVVHKKEKILIPQKWLLDLANLKNVEVTLTNEFNGISVEMVVVVSGGENGEFYAAKFGIQNHEAICRVVYGEPGDSHLARVIESAFLGDVTPK